MGLIIISTCTKIGLIQRGVAWPLCKDDTEIHVELHSLKHFPVLWRFVCYSSDLWPQNGLFIPTTMIHTAFELLAHYRTVGGDRPCWGPLTVGGWCGVSRVGYVDSILSEIGRRGKEKTRSVIYLCALLLDNAYFFLSTSCMLSTGVGLSHLHCLSNFNVNVLLSPSHQRRNWGSWEVWQFSRSHKSRMLGTEVEISIQFQILVSASYSLLQPRFHPRPVGTRVPRWLKCSQG